MTRVRATSLLAGIGGGVGFVIGTVLLAALQVSAPGGFNWAVDIPFGMMFGGTFGAAVGAVGAPAMTWLLLRHVPLNRAILLCALGTVGGALIGMAASGRPVIGGCTGFVLAAVVMRIVYRGKTA
jgi:hypothetical protein